MLYVHSGSMRTYSTSLFFRAIFWIKKIEWPETTSYWDATTKALSIMTGWQIISMQTLAVFL